MASKTIISQISKWGPSVVSIIGIVAAFIMPSVQAQVKAHPTDLAWAIVWAVILHFKKSPVAQ